MRVAGIIAEYDPFHNGHKAHIDATRQDGGATHIVAVISGSYTQRGEPAAYSKFQRTEMALSSGADLVLELPLPWSMASAERFAAGGVALLKGLGCVELLSFGSECGDLPALQRLATLPDTDAFRLAFHQALDTGIPYAAARQQAAASLVGDEDAVLLMAPNNTLGLEYLRASAAQGAVWDYFTLARQGALHHETAPNFGFASGTAIRAMVKYGDLEEARQNMPAPSYRVVEQAIQQGTAPIDETALHLSILTRLRQMSLDEMAQLPYLSEGLENRLYKAVQTATSCHDILEAVKTRRYPYARIRRILWAALLGLTKEDVTGLPPYIRVLGMNGRGREILAAASPVLPLVTRTVQLNDLDERANRVFRLECGATDLRALLLPTRQPCGLDYTQKLISL